MSTITINNTQLEFDTLDADTMAGYELALAKVEAVDETVLKGLKASESIRKQCHAIFDFFNEIFGQGTDKQLFGERTNLGICMDAFSQVIDEAAAQQVAYNKRLQKYAPNRVKTP